MGGPTLRAVALIALALLAITPLAVSHEGPHPPTAAFVTPNPGDVVLWGDRTPGPVGPTVVIGDADIVIGGATAHDAAGLARLELWFTIEGQTEPKLLTACDFAEHVHEGTCTWEAHGQRAVGGYDLLLTAVAIDEDGATDTAEMRLVRLDTSLVDETLGGLGHNPYG